MSLLHRAVTRQAERRPDASALVMRDERMTYAELEQLASRIANALVETGCRPGDRVSLLLPKSPLTIAAIHGALKAGCLFVPMDTASPPARVARILEVCEPRVVLASPSSARTLSELPGGPLARGRASIGWLERGAPPDELNAAFTLEDVETLPATMPEVARQSDDPSHILFTSGSTGVPKGVVITHSNVATFVKWACEYFEVTSTDRHSGHPPLHFDLSTMDTFGTFYAGAELHLIPPELSLLPHKLADYIRDAQLTQWFSVPSVLNYMAKLDAVEPDDFLALKRLIWCGEVLPTPTLIYWMSRVGHASFTNLYGPTETTIASSYHTVLKSPSHATESIPIGSPCRGEQLLVLGDAFERLPAGEVGNLFIQGAGLSPGYWGEPAKTADAFRPNPHGSKAGDRLYRTGDLASADESGLFWFHGRSDTQIKSRGYRIELGEIETALAALDWLEESAIVAVQTDGFQGMTICCAYSVVGDREVRPSKLRQALSEQLPSYMLPTHWAQLGELPKNANGKVDRPRLSEQFALRLASQEVDQ